MRNPLKALLFVSAFSPSLVSVGIGRIISGASFFDAVYYIVAGVFGSLTVVYIITALRWQGEAFPFQARKIESNDALLIGVVSTYIFPFFVRAADITAGIVVALIVVLWAVFWFTDATAPSPLMRVMGFRFYKAEASNGMVYTLITNRQIFDPSDVKLVKRISASMLLEVGR